MAANRFATMLHRKSNKIVVILLYAVLEWILIFLLLMNSFFSYLIRKYAEYFGLKPPCPWCSRLDHVLDRQDSISSIGDLVCERHATEISKLSYCLNHQKLAKTQDMCEDCFTSRPIQENVNGITHSYAFISLVTEDTQQQGESGSIRCTCCNGSLYSKAYSSCLLLKPSSWCKLEYTHRGSKTIEDLDDEHKGIKYEVAIEPDSPVNYKVNGHEIEDHNEEGLADEHQVLSDVDSFSLREASEEDYSKSLSNFIWNDKETNEDRREASSDSTEKSSYEMKISSRITNDTSRESCFMEDHLLKAIDQHVKRYSSGDTCRIMSTDMIDHLTCEDQTFHFDKGEHVENRDREGQKLPLNQNGEKEILCPIEAVSIEIETTDKTRDKELESPEMDSSDSTGQNVLYTKDSTDELTIMTIQAGKTNTAAHEGTDTANPEDLDEPLAREEETVRSQTLADLTLQKEDISDSPQRNDLSQLQEPVCTSTEPKEELSLNDGDCVNIPNSINEFGDECKNAIQVNVPIDSNQETTDQNLILNSEPEGEEEKFPDTPTSLDGFNYLHKKLLISEKRESSIESMDGSVVSEMECDDPVVMVERLKAALRAEQKTLRALYAELEEERSASAVAANQTMAMITRLQEEKATMQMEALQYQRMMEEQSEYDQEALQLLNELMLKREKEKEELEKELEIYRQKVLEYEAEEKVRIVRSIAADNSISRDSSSACNEEEYSDGLSIDLNRDFRDEGGNLDYHQESCNKNSSVDEILNLEEMALDCMKHMSTLDDSLAEFDEERLSILDQLKALEDKLIAMSGNEEFLDVAKPDENLSKHGLDNNCESLEFMGSLHNGDSIGSSMEFDENCHSETESIPSLAKSLLALFEATESEASELTRPDEQNPAGSHDHPNSDFEEEKKKVAIEEEVDRVYQKLQALETDQEFLQDCMSSIKQGEDGRDVLREILQHLHDLKNVELRVRNMAGRPLS